MSTSNPPFDVSPFASEKCEEYIGAFLNVSAVDDTLPLLGENSQIGDFRIVKSIRKAKFSHVYLASHIRSPDRYFIVKQFADEKIALHEFRVAQDLIHPYIQPASGVFSAFATFETDDESRHHYIVKPYYGPYTLEHLIQARTLSETDCIHIASCLLSAVKYIHSRGYIHCDIAPRNVCVTPSRDPVLIDFHACRRVVDDVHFHSHLATLPDQLQSICEHDLPLYLSTAIDIKHLQLTLDALFQSCDSPNLNALSLRNNAEIQSLQDICELIAHIPTNTVKYPLSVHSGWHSLRPIVVSCLSLLAVLGFVMHWIHQFESAQSSHFTDVAPSTTTTHVAVEPMETVEPIYGESTTTQPTSLMFRNEAQSYMDRGEFCNLLALIDQELAQGRATYDRYEYFIYASLSNNVVNLEPIYCDASVYARVDSDEETSDTRSTIALDSDDLGSSFTHCEDAPTPDEVLLVANTVLNRFKDQLLGETCYDLRMLMLYTPEQLRSSEWERTFEAVNDLLLSKGLSTQHHRRRLLEFRTGVIYTRSTPSCVAQRD